MLVTAEMQRAPAAYAGREDQAQTQPPGRLHPTSKLGHFYLGWEHQLLTKAQARSTVPYHHLIKVQHSNQRLRKPRGHRYRPVGYKRQQGNLVTLKTNKTGKEKNHPIHQSTISSIMGNYVLFHEMKKLSKILKTGEHGN